MRKYKTRIRLFSSPFLILQISLLWIHFDFSSAEDVTGFEIAVGGTNLVKLQHGGNATVDLVYETGGSGLTFSAGIDTGTTFDTSSANKDETAKTISYNINPAFLSSDGYGTYLLTFNLTPSAGVKATKEVVIFYEEPILGFAINRYPYLPLDEEIFFDVTFTSGSNVETEWFLDSNDTCLLKHDGQPRNLNLNFTFTVPGQHNVTVVAANTVTRTFDSMLVYAYYRVNGFSLTVDSAVVGTTTDARFVVLLTTSAKQPMGTIKMNVSYGDGQEETKELDSEISNMQGSGYAITHSYTIQGNYTAEFTIYNEIDTMNFTIDVYIWDEVTVTLQSKFIGQVSEDISFDFINPPPTGFTYIIEYGNGDTRTNNDSVWYSAYSESAWTYAYNADGIYNVTMTAWNQFYASVCTYIITIQYPIVEINMTLTPETTKIPIPDGIMDFELTMSKQYTSPTDVLCTFDFQDDKEENVSIAIEFGTPINKRYPYSSSGSRVVNFTCWNLVSTMTKLSNIEIVDFTLQDFGVNYLSPLTMNSTLSEELNENYPKTSNIMKLSHTTANVTFFVHLLECSKLPPDIIFKWEFGDDTPSERGLVSFEKEHVYVERGTFTIQVTIDNNRTGETHAMTTFDIQIGVVQFKVTPQRGEVSVTNFRFDFENDMGGSVSYTFDSPVSVHTTSNKYITHTYNDWGIYQASVLASNGTLTEIAFLEEPVQADYFISDELKVTITNGTGYETESIHLPPGNISITIGAARAISRPYINCSINLGDLINKENQYRYGNITISQSLELDSNYYTLGNHSLRVDCSNFVSNISEAYFIDVHNECYTRDGIFDRQYSSFKTPMKAYTSVDTSLASRMGVRCIEKDASFEWTVDRVEIINETDVLTPLEYRPTFNRGSARFARGSVSQGLLYITLNVSLDGTWMNEFTYLQFIKPAPYAFILGGNKRSLKYMDGFVELDALTESYDSERGYGGNSNLTFIWTCWKVTAGSLDEVEKKFDTERNSLGNCVLEERIRGYATLNFSIGTPTQGYAIFVEVSDGLKSSNFTQFIILKPGDPPSIKITCILNCRDKTAISSPLIMKTVCLDCREDEEILYVWSLWIYNSVSKEYSLVNDLSANTATGVNQPSMKINADFMLPGQKYSLRLDASSTMVGRNGTTNVVTAIMTNFPPQVGSAGGCVPDKTEYQTPTEKVKVDCKHFADEGDLMDQDYDRDLLRNEPLIYLYETKTMRYDDDTGDEEEVVAELYKGGESSVINLPVQMGDPHYNYSVEMRVLVYDRYGDSCMVYFNFTVRPFQGGVPANGSDTSGIEDMFNSFDKGLNITNAGGNDMAVVRQIGSLASVFAPSSEEDEETLENVDKEDSPVKKLYKEKTTELSAIVKTAVLSSTGESKQISASDSQQVSRNVETLFKNTAYVSDETAKNGAKICSALIDNIKNITTHSKPFPVEDLKSIEGAIDGTIATIDKILDALLPNDTQVDTSQEPVLDDIYNDLLEQRKLTNNTEIDEDALRQEADDLFKLKKFKYDQMKQKQSTAEESVPNVLNAIESSYNVKLQTTEVGAGPSKIIRPNLELSVEKVTKEILQNRTETPIKGIKLSLDQNDTEAIQGTLDIKQTVFNKPPTIYGDGIASLTSSALQLELSNKSIIPNLSFENKQTAYANRFEPQMTAGDPEQMFYLNFYVKNDDDVALVYVEPDNFDIYNRNTWTLYELYYRAATFPKTSIFSFYKEFSIRDYTEGLGFKVMIPPMKKGQHFLGFKALSVPEPSKRRKRRSVAVDNTTTVAPSNTTNQLINVNVSVVLVTTGCRSWNEAEKKWVSDGCTVLPMSTPNETVCRCPRAAGNLFATTFYVPPNTIDFATVFSKFDASNAAIYGTCIALIAVWIIAVVLLRRQDLKDQERWSTYFLCDSDATDEYFYMVSVHTGLRKGAGTQSRVNFVLSGEDDDSGVRILSDGVRKGFPTGSVRSFFMGTKYPLGDLTYLRIWHDNSGEGGEQSWYLNKVTVDDPQRHARYTFICERWLAVERDDGQVERVLPVCGRENLLQFNTLFFQHAQFNITENHLWLSLLIRPQRSSFTRVQRASCILALLFLTMIANAMFFRSSSEEVNPNEVQIGILRFSMSILFISIIGILITTPPILIVTIIFKKCKPKPVTNRHKEIKDKMKQQVLNSMTKETQQMLRSEELFSSDHLPLPYWTVYIAWVIVAIAVATSAFFLLLYSMQWGKSKSEEWLSSFVFSFFESLLLVDPFKVVLIALIFAILFRRPVDGSSPKVNMERLRDASMAFSAGSTRTYLALWNDVIMKNKKTSEEELKKVRKRREQELRAMDALMNLIMYGVFVFILYSISYVNRDQRSFFLKNNVDNYLHAHGFGQVGFSSVNGREQWKEWMDKTLIPTCYPKEEYNGSPLSTTDTQFFGDLTNVRVGPARLRQVRMATDGCVYKKLTWPYPCVNPYNQYNEDESDYWLEWKPYNATLYNTPAYTNKYLTADAWKYTKSKDIWGIPITGQYATYGGGGYLLKFPKDRILSERMLNELMEFNWIDRGTRAVFMEFTLYNANTNLFLYAQFLAEFSELGGAFNWIESQAFRPVTTVSGVGTFSLLCYILFCFHLIITTVKTVLRMKKLGCKSFLFDPWNVVDSFCVFLSYALIFMFGFRLSYANQAMQKYYDDLGTGARDFINFQHIVVWDNSFNVVLATLVFIATIRILRILGYNKRFSEVASVISHAAGELMGFSVVFGIIYFAYISLGYLLFGVSLKEYRSPFATWGSLTNALIGKNSLDKMLAVAPQMAQFYYFTYVFCVLMTLATMFAAILNKSISEVRAESSKEPETFGITNLLTKSIQDVFGFASKSKNKNIQRKNGLSVSTEHIDFDILTSIEYTPIPGKTNFDAPNILRLVRETFGEYDDDEKKPIPEAEVESGMAKKLKLSDQDLLLDRAGTPFSPYDDMLRTETPRDIKLLLEDCNGKKTPHYPHFL